jgi:hypothetical protein
MLKQKPKDTKGPDKALSLSDDNDLKKVLENTPTVEQAELLCPCGRPRSSGCGWFRNK